MDRVSLSKGKKTKVAEPLEDIIRSFQAFTKHNLAGASLLLLATCIAIVWANSQLKDSYFGFLHLKAVVALGSFDVKKDLIHWVNDGLMGIFFFVVGLEIKREMLAGELSSVRKVILPFSAAFGGMLIPALIYIYLNPIGVAFEGWGIPMATDIAFALGVMALLGDRVPSSLKIFLTAFAIFDDIGAVLVIAIFYTDTISIVSLAIAGVLLIFSIAANFGGIKNSVFYFILGTLVWLAFLKSGVHATLASVLMALTIPSRTRSDSNYLLQKLEQGIIAFRKTGFSSEKKLLTQDQMHAISGMEEALVESTPPLQRIEHALLPLVTFLILPVFALANAGVTISSNFSSAFQNPICIGIILGLFIGKPVGIFGFSWIAVQLKMATLPDSISWKHIFGVAVLGGIGFTMALFIGGLAFSQTRELEVVKIAVLTASVFSSCLGWYLLYIWTFPVTRDEGFVEYESQDA